MTTARLLEHFDRISETHGAVARLRRFVLDLAVRGKLVGQDPTDEPAAELLKQIQREKVRLVKDGTIRNPRVIEADVRGREMRRQRGDVGLINERYGLVLFGNGQKLELHPWQAADEMTVRVPFAWDPDRWYRMKLRVDHLPNGTARVRGKVWPARDAEPSAWTVEKVDTIPHKMGSPGFYADGISDVYFDNFKIYKTQ